MISVILPAYNAQDTIAEAIQSIIDQTYKDWELIVINDGSSDDTKSIILSFPDPRIKYIENDGNKKLIYTLNRGLKLATGKYIARMDADDISLPTRFERQVLYMENHPDCVCCGSLIHFFSNNRLFGKPVGISGDDIKLKEYLFRDSCFAHSTVMIRTEVIKKCGLKYNSIYIHAEDYKLWIDLSEYGMFHNIKEPLLNYRISGTQVSNKYRNVQLKTSNRCRREYIESHVNNDSFRIDIRSNHITLDTLRKYRLLDLHYAYLLEVLYLSMEKYGIKELLYFLVSMDILRVSPKTVLAFFKRMLCGKDSLLD